MKVPIEQIKPIDLFKAGFAFGISIYATIKKNMKEEK